MREAGDGIDDDAGTDARLLFDARKFIILPTTRFARVKSRLSATESAAAASTGDVVIISRLCATVDVKEGGTRIKQKIKM